MQYLIAHKVRGEPAFDVAERRGDYWYSVIDESRCWPYWFQVLDPIPDPPEDWDDYLEQEAVKFAITHPQPKQLSLLASLGLGRSEPKVTRR